MVDNILLTITRLLFWIGIFSDLDTNIQAIRENTNTKKRNGGKAMLFDRKNMKIIKFNQVGEYLAEGKEVYMVSNDEQLVLINLKTDWSIFFMHQLTGGRYAVYRQKRNFGTFTKNINLGGWSFSVSHVERGGEE